MATLNGKDMEDYSEIKLLELELANPDTRKNLARLNDLISDDFEEYGSSGRVYRKQNVLNALPKEEPTNYELSSFTFYELSKNCILVKYKSIVSGNHALRSSIWVKHNNQWQMLHHQATVVPTAI